MKKIIRVLVLAFVIVSAAGCICFGSSGTNTDSVIDCSLKSVGGRPVIVSDGIVKFTGNNTVIPVHAVYVDDKLKGNVDGCGSKWQYTINTSDMNAGWHYVFFSKTTSDTRGCGWGYYINKPENGPVAIIPERMVISARAENNDTKRNYKSFEVEGLDYDSHDVYWGAGKHDWNVSEDLKFDKNRIPMICYNKKTWCYNATTICQYALGWYSKSFKTDQSSDDYKYFIRYCNWLVDNQHDDGSFRYDTMLSYRDDTLEPGWVSGMAQGQVLSLMSRAYYVTGDDRYLKCGEKTLDFMLKPAGSSMRDGTRDTISDFTSLNGYFSKYSECQLYEEVLTKPRSHILNGDLFALIGLHDWATTCPDRESAAEAKAAFEGGAKSIAIMLPYYDFYGYSAYDIMQYTGNYEARFQSGYAHACHVVLLKAMYDITGNEEFNEYYLRFKAYCDDPFFGQSNDMYDASRSFQ